MPGLLLAMLTAFSPPHQTDVEAHVGLEFGDALSQRERKSLRVSFEQALPKACTPQPPCTTNCSDDQASVGVSIDGQNRNYTLRWSATDPRLDAPLTLESSCELCSLIELEEQLAADLGTLCARLSALEQVAGSVQITATPDRAWVRIDRRLRGRTPWTGQLDAGPHELELRARGFGRETRTLQIFGGVAEHQHFELLRASSGVRPSWPGWASLGLGVALGIAGTALIALDGKDWPGRCSGGDVDASGNCRFVYATQSLGIALALVGTAALASGVGLLVWSSGGKYGGGVAVRGRF